MSDRWDRSRVWIDALREESAEGVDIELSARGAKELTNLLEYAITQAEDWHRTADLRAAELAVTKRILQEISLVNRPKCAKLNGACSECEKGQRGTYVEEYWSEGAGLCIVRRRRNA